MNNRYLFKAKRTDNREWEIGHLAIYPYGRTMIGNMCENPPDDDTMWRKCLITHDVVPSTICQCTGLNDENGNLIWENDVIRVADEKYLIKWQDDSAMWGLYKMEIQRLGLITIG